jgi:hypothetical protein
MRRRRMYGWDGDGGWGGRGMTVRRRWRTRGGAGRYGSYTSRFGGGAWGDRRITLRPGMQIIIEAV